MPFSPDLITKGKDLTATWFHLFAIIVWLVLAWSPCLAQADLAFWPQWRGPLATGVAPHADPPVEWSEDQNVRWKIELPGKGHSTPIIWEDRIYLTTAIPSDRAVEAKYSHSPGAHDNLPVTHAQKFVALALNRTDGSILWRKTVQEALPHEGGHHTASMASNSPVTDGEHVFAFFGSYGLFAMKPDGQIEWQADLGDMQIRHAHGEGSSPALYHDTLIVNWDHEGQSFIVAFDKRTGLQRWKVPRDEVTTWATPIVVEQNNMVQVIASGTNRIRAYNLDTGKTIWECGGMSRNIVASPVAADGVVYAGSSYDLQAMLAIRLDGAMGDVTGTNQVIWKHTQGTPYVPSPLLYGKWLYILRHYQGVLTRIEAKTGHPEGPFRLAGIRNVYASPVGAAGRVYITDLDGTTLVISHDESMTILGFNRLDDSFSASAAIAGRELFLRGEKFLYCLAED